MGRGQGKTWKRKEAEDEEQEKSLKHEPSLLYVTSTSYNCNSRPHNHCDILSEKMPSVSVKDVSQQEFTMALAAFLKKSGKMKVPEWVDLVKTNNRKELAPYDEDWFYVRTASMARHMYIRSPIGVSTVKKIYGIRSNNGSSP